MTDHPRARATLAASSSRLEGIGLHSGRPSWIELHPANLGDGIVFVDDATSSRIPATTAAVVDTSRCTQIAGNGVTLQTIEHLMSALAGCGVDDAVVRFSGPEIPAVDGSAAPFAALIRATGVRPQPGDRLTAPLTLQSPLLVQDAGATVLAIPADRTSYTVVLDYPKHPYIGTQSAYFDPETMPYEDEIAPARTYGFASELDALRARGLALGASKENALPLGEDEYLGSLRYDNELARHKLLDLIGDLALVGRLIVAQFVAVKPSHALNARTAALLAEHP